MSENRRRMGSSTVPLSTLPARRDRRAATGPGVHEVALVAGRWDAAARYRCSHAREQLALTGVRAGVASVLDADVMNRLSGCRVAIFHRIALDRHTEGLYRQIRQRGGLIVYDTDDLVFDAEARLAVPHRLYGLDSVRAAWVREDARAQREGMERADAVLAATDYLADEVRRFGKPVWVHRNGFSLEMLRLSDKARAAEMPAKEVPAQQTRQEALARRDGPTGRGGPAERPGRLVVGYTSGTPTHDGDFGVAKPALVRLLQMHEHVELWLVGPVDPGDGWGTARGRIKRLGLVPWQRLPSVLAQFDVSIAPLESEKRFCRAKSEVKYIESGLVAVPVVASAGAGFDQAIRSGDNGLLAASAEDWAAHLEMLIDDQERRMRIGERARADVLARYHPAVRGRELVGILNAVSTTLSGRALWPENACKLATYAAADGPGCGAFEPAAWSVPRRPSRSERDPEAAGARLIRRGLYSLRFRSVRVFLMEVWIYARGWWKGLLARDLR